MEKIAKLSLERKRLSLLEKTAFSMRENRFLLNGCSLSLQRTDLCFLFRASLFKHPAVDAVAFLLAEAF